MILDLIFVISTLIALIVASISDIKLHEVPDWISYSLISIGFSLRFLYSLTSHYWAYFLLSLLSFSIVFAIGNILYYTKQLGGGDVKIALALSVLFPTFQKDFFLINFFINLLIIGCMYTMIISLFLILKNKHKFKIAFLNQIKKVKIFNYIAVPIAIFMLIFTFFIYDLKLKIFILITSLITLSYPYLILAIKATELSCMYKFIPVKKLTEGDWITNNLYLNKKLIYNKNSPGINKKQLSIIKNSKIKSVLIKEGIPFIPAFLISFIITLLFENLILKLI